MSGWGSLFWIVKFKDVRGICSGICCPILFIIFQLDIPSHLLHETKCIEACRTAYWDEGYSVFDKQDKKCTCVDKSSSWSALADPTAAIPTPIIQQDCYKFRYKVNISISQNMAIYNPGRFTKLNWSRKPRTATSCSSRDRSTGGILHISWPK